MAIDDDDGAAGSVFSGASDKHSPVAEEGRESRLLASVPNLAEREISTDRLCDIGSYFLPASLPLHMLRRSS